MTLISEGSLNATSNCKSIWPPFLITVTALWLHPRGGQRKRRNQPPGTPPSLIWVANCNASGVSVQNRNSATVKNSMYWVFFK